VQLVVVAVEPIIAETAPPEGAELEVIVQSVAVKAELPDARAAPPAEKAELEVIAQSVTMTVEAPTE